MCLYISDVETFGIYESPRLKPQGAGRAAALQMDHGAAVMEKKIYNKMPLVRQENDNLCEKKQLLPLSISSRC